MNAACPRRVSLITALGLPTILSPTIGATTGVRPVARRFGSPPSLTSYWNERKAHETGVVPISSGYRLGFWRGREERCQAQFL